MNILDLSFTYNLNCKLHKSRFLLKQLLWSWSFCWVSAIFLLLLIFFFPTANSLQGPYSPMYRVLSTCKGGFTHAVLSCRVESKAFRLNSSPLTDCLQLLFHRCKLASLAIFYHYFHVHCSSDNDDASFEFKGFIAFI